MKLKLTILSILTLILTSAFYNNRSFQYHTAGCSGKGCHTEQNKKIEITPLDNLQIQVYVKDVKRGETIGGELIDNKNRIVDFISGTNNNPFILTAPEFGKYIVNAGFKNPSPIWDSGMIMLRPTTLNIPVPSQVRTNLALYPSHPNPFRRETVIKFSLPKSAYVELLVFTENGQLVKQLAEGWIPSGAYAVRWNGRNHDGLPCPPGVYLCEIKSENKRIVRSMILAK